MFKILQKFNQKPKLYADCTIPLLWNDPYTSQRMLDLHLDDNTPLASRSAETIDKSVEWICSHFDVDHTTKIADFGCGPGLYTTRFAEKGARVTGIDLSERSIHYAQKQAAEKNLSIQYILQDYLTFSTEESFDLITMIYCDFCALNTEQRKIILNKFFEILKPNGTVLLDVYSTHYFETIEEKRSYEYSSGNGFWSAAPYYEFLNVFKYEEEKILLFKYTLLEETRTREVFNWLKCYSCDSLREELRESGFQLTECYSNMTGDAYQTDSTEIAIVAKKIEN